MNNTGSMKITLKFKEAEGRTGLRRKRLRELIKCGTLKTIGKGPGKRILISSIEDANLPEQQQLKMGGV